MKVVHVSDCFLPRLGGIEVQVAELSRMQAEAGHEVAVVTATPERLPPGDEPPYAIHRLTAALPWELPVDPHASRRVGEVLDRLDPDVVHVHVGAVSPFGWAAAHRARVAGRPTTVTVHSMWDPLTFAGYRALDRVSGWTGWGMVITTVSSAAAVPIRRAMAGRGPVHVVANGIDVDQWRLPVPGGPIEADAYAPPAGQAHPDDDAPDGPDTGDANRPDASRPGRSGAGDQDRPDAGRPGQPSTGDQNRPDAGRPGRPSTGDRNRPDAGGPKRPGAGDQERSGGVVLDRVGAARRELADGGGGVGRIRVAAVGRLAPRKHPVALLRLLRNAAGRLPGALTLEATIVGDGPGRPAMERYLRRHRMEYVELTGRLDRPRVREVLARSDLFLAPAPRESFGLAALEARTAGLPVVALTCSGVADFVRPGREGLLGRTRTDLADAIVRLATDSGLRHTIATHNRRTAPDGCTWPEVLEAFDKRYAEALAG